MKLLQDHQEASNKDGIDERKAQRFAGMLTILEDVKIRLQKAQPPVTKRQAELRRCNTDLKINPPPKNSRKTNETLILDEKEKLRRDLNISFAAQKRLGVMCATIGREKEIIARELTRKVQEVNELEEHVNDLIAQNEKLTGKIQAYVAEKKEIKRRNADTEYSLRYAASKERNKELSEQLQKSLEGYKLFKRKHIEVQEERDAIQAAMVEVREDVKGGINLVHSLKQCVDDCSLGEQAKDIDDKITRLDQLFQKLESKSSGGHRRIQDPFLSF